MAEGKRQSAIWSDEQKNNYQALFISLKPVLGYSGIMDWLFSYKPRTNGSQYYMEIYNRELEIATEAYKSSFENEANDILQEIGSNINLQKFNFIAQNYATIIEASMAENLITKLSEYITEKNFHWDMALSALSFPVMKSFGLVLSKCLNPVERAWKLLDDFSVYFEGWNIKDDYEGVNREAFINCGVILLIEHPEVFKDDLARSSFLRKIIDRLISRTRFADYQESYYNIAFILLDLVVNQVQHSDKSYFETQLIVKLDNIVDLLEILSTEKYKLESESKILLQERIDREMIFIKRKNGTKEPKKRIGSIRKCR